MAERVEVGADVQRANLCETQDTEPSVRVEARVRGSRVRVCSAQGRVRSRANLASPAHQTCPSDWPLTTVNGMRCHSRTCTFSRRVCARWQPDPLTVAPLVRPKGWSPSLQHSHLLRVGMQAGPVGEQRAPGQLHGLHSRKPRRHHLCP